MGKKKKVMLLDLKQISHKSELHFTIKMINESACVLSIK